MLLFYVYIKTKIEFFYQLKKEGTSGIQSPFSDSICLSMLSVSWLDLTSIYQRHGLFQKSAKSNPPVCDYFQLISPISINWL